MGDKARQYKRSTIRRLDTLSGNECAEPTCTKPLIAEDEQSIISKICHIEAASSNGPRWNSMMTDDDRRHDKNLILLCDEHHTMIDSKENEGVYTVEVLKEWKVNHESKMLYKLRDSSFLKVAINAISDLDLSGESDSEEMTNSFDIEAKIGYNDIARNKFIIEDYKVFYPKVNALYKELESQGSFKKEKLLRNINLLYLRAKGKYVTKNSEEIEQIRINADNIFEEIENQLLTNVMNSSNNYDEDVIFSVSVIMVDAFMRCKILEEPI